MPAISRSATPLRGAPRGRARAWSDCGAERRPAQRWRRHDALQFPASASARERDCPTREVEGCAARDRGGLTGGVDADHDGVEAAIHASSKLPSRCDPRSAGVGRRRQAGAVLHRSGSRSARGECLRRDRPRHGRARDRMNVGQVKRRVALVDADAREGHERQAAQGSRTPPARTVSTDAHARARRGVSASRPRRGVLVVSPPGRGARPT